MQLRAQARLPWQPSIIHRQTALLAPRDHTAKQALPWEGSALSELCFGLPPATTPFPCYANPALPTTRAGQGFFSHSFSGWQGQMTNTQLSGTPAALWIYTVLKTRE